jgi:hypothetical protein
MLLQRIDMRHIGIGIVIIPVIDLIDGIKALHGESMINDLGNIVIDLILDHFHTGAMQAQQRYFKKKRVGCRQHSAEQH